MSDGVTWKEKIVCALAGRNNEKLWFTHGKIKADILEAYPDHYMPRSISAFITELIKQGYVERALKPDHLHYKHKWQTEFLYRWTGREYTKTETYDKFYNPSAIKQGRELWRANKSLPRWFRRMMMD